MAHLCLRLRHRVCGYLESLYDHSQLANTPFFRIDSNLIEIIEDPLEFYLSLNRGIKNSFARVGLSSLYLGTGAMEKLLLTNLAKKHRQNPQFQSIMLFDYNRSQRMQDGESTETMLKNWQVEISNDRAQIGLQRGTNRNGKIGQIAGVHHQKIYLFDDMVIMGGANLSQNYFLNRRDRYLLIRHHPELCDYLFDYLAVVVENCPIGANRSHKNNLERHFKLWKYGYTPEEYKSSIYEQERELDLREAQRNQEQERGIETGIKSKKQVVLSRNQKIAQEIGTSVEVREEITVKERMSRKEQTREKLFTATSEHEVANELMEIQQSDEHKELLEKGEKVYIFPFMSIPRLKQSEGDLLRDLMEYANESKHNIRIASGYLNFSREALSNIFNGGDGNLVKILCSSPQANSFFRAGTFKQYIPIFYRNFERDLLLKYPRTQIKQFNNGEWSFHAKGIWIEENETSYFTVVGSSNYNHRSNYRDSELQMYLYSTCPAFNKRLNEQWSGIERHCKLVTVADLQSETQIKANWLYSLVAKVFRSFL